MKGQRVRIGFVHATNEFDVQWFKPLAFGYLKAYLVKHLGDAVEMCFVESPDHFDTYDILAISATSQNYARAVEIATAAKRACKETLTVLGGHHVTCLPSTLSPAFDLGVLHEGEQTFLEVVQEFVQNGPLLSPDRLQSIRGLAFWKNDALVCTGPRELIQNLDFIPHPDRSLGGDPYIFTSRGCPYRCTFCGSSAFWATTRLFSADYVVEEILQILQRFPSTEHIQIQDDLFVLDLRRFVRICELLKSHGLRDRLSFSFAVRANLVSDAFCETLRNMNIRSVYFGAESASDRILRILGKRTTAEQNQKALDTLHRHGIHCVCSFVVGVPSETEAEVRATYEFLLRNSEEGKIGLGAPVNILMPLPGTAMWELAVQKGIIRLEDFDWNRLAIFASYRHSNIQDIEDWFALRREYRSVYMNAEALPEERLFEIMAEYEKPLKALESKRSPKHSHEPLMREIREDSQEVDQNNTVLRKIRSWIPLWEKTLSGLRGENLSVRAAVQIGEVCFEMGLLAEAGFFFRKALSREPENAEALNNLGVLEARLGNWDSAKRKFEQVLKSHPSHPEARQNLLVCLDRTRQGNGSEAQRVDTHEQAAGQAGWAALGD
jgi:anaerobic magnesium-protoporphyrin IX monomethyl ester cyclase